MHSRTAQKGPWNERKGAERWVVTENEISSMVVDGATEVHPTLVGLGLI